MEEIPEVNNVNGIFLKMVDNLKSKLDPKKVK
jgi:hypothetical protein